MNIKAVKDKILYIFTFIFFGVFYYFLPFAGDDWAWGSDLGIDRLKNAFDGYNGRYLGNLLIILITRSVIAKIVICTLTIFLLIYIMSKIFDNLSNKINSSDNYILAFLSVLIMVLPNQIAFGDLQPFQIFGSTIGWLSGFTNYVVPSVLILVYYYFVTSKGNDNKLVYIMLVLDGLFASLCVEHYTLFCLIFSFFVIAYRYCFYKKVCKKSVAFLSGSFVGFVIMFTNSSYRLMQKGDVSNNQRAVGFIGSVKKYADYIIPKGTSKALAIAFEIALLIMILSLLIFFMFKIFKTIKSKGISKMLPLICLFVMTVPLLFTNSGKEIYVIAPRCYFLQYFMLVIYIYDRLAGKSFAGGKKFADAIKISFIVLLIITGSLYARLDYIGAVRDKLVNEAIENDYSNVNIIEYPKSVEHIQWASNFINNETYFERYKSFKNIPDDKAVNIIDYKK